MKTKQELLDFYGIEVGKRYRITTTDFKSSGTNIFTVGECSAYYGGLVLRFEDNSNEVHTLMMLNECCYEEYKPPILDDKEREYLQKYVMNNPAFKGKVKYIVKYSIRDNEYIAINLTTVNSAYLPEFKPNSMYKGMEIRTRYTPEELNLKE